MEDLETFALFRVTGLKLTDQRSYVTDVVRKGNAAESFNEN
jgi:Fe2+ or Zn2+ uptake regulation protein